MLSKAEVFRPTYRLSNQSGQFVSMNCRFTPLAPCSHLQVAVCDMRKIAPRAKLNLKIQWIPYTYRQTGAEAAADKQHGRLHGLFHSNKVRSRSRESKWHASAHKQLTSAALQQTILVGPSAHQNSCYCLLVVLSHPCPSDAHTPSAPCTSFAAATWQYTFFLLHAPWMQQRRGSCGQLFLSSKSWPHMALRAAGPQKIRLHLPCKLLTECARCPQNKGPAVVEASAASVSNAPAESVATHNDPTANAVKRWVVSMCICRSHRAVAAQFNMCSSQPVRYKFRTACFNMH